MHHADGDTTVQYIADTESVVASTPTAKATFYTTFKTLKHSTLEPNAPIGLFDSGVGGLSIYQHLKQTLPHERYIYYADTLHLPYGERSFAEIENLTLDAVAWLIEAGCKLVIVACNSASTHALDSLRDRYQHIPIVGLVPALKPAVLSTKTGQVAVLATRATLEGKLLNQVIAEYALPNNVTVTKWCDAGLVPWVEAGMPNHAPAAMGLVAKLNEIAGNGVDYVVLGCTHYPFFRPFLQTHIDANNLGITLIDSGQAIAARVQNLLLSSYLQVSHRSPQRQRCDTSNGDTAKHDKLERNNDNNGDTQSHIIDGGTKGSKLQFFSTKSEPHLQSLVMRLVDEKWVDFI